MAIWNNTASLTNSLGYGYQVNPGITIKPIDIRPFLDDSGNGQVVRKSSNTKEDKPIEGVRYGVGAAYENNKSIADAEQQRLDIYTSQLMMEAVQSGSQEKIQQVQQMYNQGLKSISNYRLNNELSLLTEKFQYDRWNATDKVIGEKQINQEYLITPDAGNLVDDTELFSSMPFDLTTDGKNIRPKTYDDYQILNNQESTIDPTTGQPTEYTRPKIMNSSKEVYENISKWVKDTGSSEYVNEATTTNLFNSLNAASAKTATTNQQQLNDVVMNIWGKITPEDRYYVLNNTIKQGVMMKLPGDTEKKYYTGTQALSYIEEQRIKYNNAYKNYEAALTANNREEAIKYEKEAEKYLKLGQQASTDVMNMAKINAIRIAQGQSIGLESMSLTLGEQGNSFGEFGEMDGKDASEVMKIYAGAIKVDQNMYFQGQVKDDNGIFINTESLKKLESKGGTSALSFNISAEGQNIFARKIFNAESNYKLEESKIPVSKLPNNWVMNGVYTHKSAMGDDDVLDKVFVKNVGGIGYMLPKFHNPKDGRKYSTELQRTANGTVIGQPYVSITMYTESGNADNVKLPFVEADGKTIVYKSVKELYKINRAKTNYNIQKVGNNYQWRQLTEGPNPYYGSKEVRSIGVMQAWSDAREIEAGQVEDIKRDKILQENYWNSYMKDKSGNYVHGSFANGIKYIGSPDEIFNQINAEIVSKPLLVGDPELYFYNKLDILVDNARTPEEGEKLKKELINKWNSKNTSTPRQRVLVYH